MYTIRADEDNQSFYFICWFHSDYEEKENEELTICLFNNYSKLHKDLIPNVVEFTFLNKSLFKEKNKVAKLPKLGFDSPSAPLRPDFNIVFN